MCFQICSTIKISYKNCSKGAILLRNNRPHQMTLPLKNQLQNPKIIRDFRRSWSSLANFSQQSFSQRKLSHIAYRQWCSSLFKMDYKKKTEISKESYLLLTLLVPISKLHGKTLLPNKLDLIWSFWIKFAVSTLEQRKQLLTLGFLRKNSFLSVESWTS